VFCLYLIVHLLLLGVVDCSDESYIAEIERIINEVIVSYARGYILVLAPFWPIGSDSYYFLQFVSVVPTNLHRSRIHPKEIQNQYKDQESIMSSLWPTISTLLTTFAVLSDAFEVVDPMIYK
ncbi:hypothetical protein M5D96_012684, partial [Drosophila gunungcola]